MVHIWAIWRKLCFLWSLNQSKILFRHVLSCNGGASLINHHLSITLLPSLWVNTGTSCKSKKARSPRYQVHVLSVILSFRDWRKMHVKKTSAHSRVMIMRSNSSREKECKRWSAKRWWDWIQGYTLWCGTSSHVECNQMQRVQIGISGSRMWEAWQTRKTQI